MSSVQMERSLRIGVDVGGTNTDAVIMNMGGADGPDRGIMAFHKCPTTSPNVTDGIESAVRNVLEQAGDCRSDVHCLVIGTTHFLNAIIENDTRRLSKVAVVRLSKSFTKEIPPFSDFPPRLKSILHGYTGYVDGGLSIDGAQEAPIVESQVISECQKIKALGLTSVVICGVFSPIDKHYRQEACVRDIMMRELPGIDIVCSSEVSNIGFLERENAAILNASILNFARRTIRGFQTAMKRLGLSCALFISQNDGTVIDAANAARFPIKTFSSGPTNSMRGAAYLSLEHFGHKSAKRTSAIVVDVGGTTTDVGILLPSGFPRQASAYSSVAGVTINFAMPHVESIGLGGGSLIRKSESGVTIGPDSVGHNLVREAMVYGGQILTATDIAVASGKLVGDPDLVSDLASDIVADSHSRIKDMLESVIDKVKSSPDPLPVLLVGGGSVICPLELNGVSEVILPNFFSVANAVGAAIARVGGTIDTIRNISDTSLAEILKQTDEAAVQEAITAGARADTVEIVERDTIPVPYVSGQIRVIARAVGDLSTAALIPCDFEETYAEEGLNSVLECPKSSQHLSVDKVEIDIATYRPKVTRNALTGVPEWFLSEIDIEFLRDGCYILGCAGGGSPKAEYIKLRDQIRDGKEIRVIDRSGLAEDARVYWGGNMGSPAVSVERLSGTEVLQAVEEMMEYLGHDTFDAVMGLEIGGANGLEPLLIGSSHSYDRPIVDADWMGRAYPTYWQTTLAVYESGQLIPCAIASGDGKTIFMTKSPNDEIVDRALRASCSEMGSRVGMAVKPTTKQRIVDYGVTNTLSLAWRIGRAVARSRQTCTTYTVVEQIIDEIGGPSSAKVLFRGKIIGVERRLYKGHSYGEVIIQQSKESDEEAESTSPAVATGGIVKIPFKNENIYVEHVAEDGSTEYLATVPDLICVLDTQTGLSIGVPEFRYGLIVTVLGMACSPRWTDTERGLEYGGPKAFGYDMPYNPLGTYVEPKSVVLEFLDKP
ncbi:hypothetical protein WAI453_004522 [Rhynchosporium graminicola]|uniref:Probable N-methylhydantoinase A/acetone carboxylase, beta subunit n=1 Tax=Rhynchosporium graminicola TaxID=2792576 RepID=A0A1E1LLQ2_9HELO|nr:probable N-methylhydantoinase A/acetone carboxylase, beta subunit [Rhynchosporium commune]